MALKDTLNTYGRAGVIALKESIASLRATGKTERSIRFEVTSSNGITRLTFYGRPFFKSLETGRGPRESTQQAHFEDEMYQYMLARGIGSNLPEKKRKQLARFLVWRANKEGDKTYQKGGRINYSPVLDKLTNEVKRAVAEDYIHSTIKMIRNVTNSNKKATAGSNA
jgi:hypothetical protein